MNLPFATFGTVEQYNRFVEKYPKFAALSGDLKNLQRPWMVDAVTRLAKPGARILEIGAFRCEIADYFQKQGYEVWNIDPYDNCGGGTTEYDETVKKFPAIRHVRAYMKDTEELPEDYFDAVYSVSVLEHVPPAEMAATVKKIFRVLRPGGVSVHAVDYTVRGPAGFMENHDQIQAILDGHGLGLDARELARGADQDLETFLLSPSGHYYWRKYNKKEYGQYPYRKVASLNIAAMRSQV